MDIYIKKGSTILKMNSAGNIYRPDVMDIELRKDPKNTSRLNDVINAADDVKKCVLRGNELIIEKTSDNTIIIHVGYEIKTNMLQPLVAYASNLQCKLELGNIYVASQLFELEKFIEKFNKFMIL